LPALDQQRARGVEDAPARRRERRRRDLLLLRSRAPRRGLQELYLRRAANEHDGEEHERAVHRADPAGPDHRIPVPLSRLA